MLHLQRKNSDRLKQIRSMALGASSISFLLFILLIHCIWRPTNQEIMLISMRQTPARVVLRSVSTRKKRIVGNTALKAVVPTNKVVSQGTLKKPVEKKIVELKKADAQVKKTIKSTPKPSKKTVQKAEKKKQEPMPVVPARKSNLRQEGKKEEKRAVEKIKKKEPALAKKTASAEVPANVLCAASTSVDKPCIQPIAIVAAPLPVVPPVEVVQPVVEVRAQEVLQVAPEQIISEALTSIDTDETVDISSAFDELDEEVDRDVAAFIGSVRRVWRLPGGLDKTLSAKIVLVLNGFGMVDKADIIESSGVVAYDLAARAALHRATYPSAFWGRRILIKFGKIL